MIDPQFDAMPEALRRHAQWVCWRLEDVPDRPEPAKVPYTPATRRRASSTEPDDWRAFAVARRAYERGDHAGVGFVLSAADPFVFVDLDHCRDPQTGVLADWAARIVAELATYAEVSCSGEGVHLVALGELAGDWHRRGGVEIYWQARYMTMTGTPIDGCPPEPQLVGEPLRRLYASLAPELPPAPSMPPGGGALLSDSEVLTKAGASRQGDKFRQLMAGDTFGYGGDDSAADLALCGMLAFWCGNDTGQMDRLFRGSGLMRPKWDTRRGRSTYGRGTLERALRSETYRPFVREEDDVSPDGAFLSDRDPSGPGAQDTAELATLRAQHEEDAARIDALNARLADALAKLDAYEVGGAAHALATERERADRQQARAEAILSIVRHHELTFRERIVTIEAREMAGAYLPRARFGEEPVVPPPVHVYVAELEARVGIPAGTAARSLRSAEALGIITRKVVAATIRLPDGSYAPRKEIWIGPGSGHAVPDWREQRRRKEAEHRAAATEKRRAEEEAHAGRLEELAHAGERAAAGCLCGGVLHPTGYFCGACNAVFTPADVLAWPVLSIRQKHMVEANGHKPGSGEAAALVGAGIRPADMPARAVLAAAPALPHPNGNGHESVAHAAAHGNGTVVPRNGQDWYEEGRPDDF